MATKDGKGQGKRRNPGSRLRYFFLHGKLHKKLHIDRASDVITAWSYPDAKRVGYTYSTVLRTYGKAFTTAEVCAMIGRGRTQVEMAIVDGQIPKPQMTYGINEKKNPHKHMWSEEDVYNLHDYFLTVHRGRPRKDGLITPQAMPSRAELRALMHNQEILYVQNDDGEFVPTWQAKF